MASSQFCFVFIAELKQGTETSLSPIPMRLPGKVGIDNKKIILKVRMKA
jgi:hypothetical protein